MAAALGRPRHRDRLVARPAVGLDRDLGRALRRAHVKGNRGAALHGPLRSAQEQRVNADLAGHAVVDRADVGEAAGRGEDVVRGGARREPPGVVALRLRLHVVRLHAVVAPDHVVAHEHVELGGREAGWCPPTRRSSPPARAPRGRRGRPARSPGPSSGRDLVDADHPLRHVLLHVAVVEPRARSVLAPGHAEALGRARACACPPARRRPCASDGRARGRCGARRRSRARPTARGRPPSSGRSACCPRRPCR